MATFLPESAYPKELAPIIEAFRQKYPEYAQPEEADGQCFMASCEFQECIDDSGLLDENERGKRWDVVRAYSVGAPGLDVRELVNQHWVVRWKNYAIDCTARQFIEQAPFPAVWELQTGEWWSGD